MLMFTTLTVSGTDDKTLDELMLKVANGDLSALEELYNLTKTGIYSFALSVLKNPSDAKDVLHDTYLSIWASAHMYESAGKPMAWMITIAKNYCYKVFRDRKWSEEENNNEITEDDFTKQSDDKSTIWQYIALLNDDERQIIVLHAVAGFKHREIAELLNMHLSTVLSKYRRGIRKLKQYLIDGGAFNEEG